MQHWAGDGRSGHGQWREDGCQRPLKGGRRNHSCCVPGIPGIHCIHCIPGISGIRGIPGFSGIPGIHRDDLGGQWTRGKQRAEEGFHCTHNGGAASRAPSLKTLLSIPLKTLLSIPLKIPLKTLLRTLLKTPLKIPLKTLLRTLRKIPLKTLLSNPLGTLQTIP